MGRSGSGFWKGQTSDGSPGSAYHSRAYHAYFEGYSEVRQMIGEKEKIVRVYTAPWYVIEGNESAWKKRRLQFGGLGFVSILAFILGAVGNGYNNLVWFTQITQAITFVFFIFFAYQLINYLLIPYRMTIAQYRLSSESLRSYIKACMVCLGFSILTQIVFLVIFSLAEDILRTVLTCVLYMIAFGCLFLLFRIDRRTQYRQEENENAEMNGIEIQR